MKYYIQFNSSTGYETRIYDSFEEASKVFEACTGSAVPKDADFEMGYRGNYCGNIIELCSCGDSYTGESDRYCGIDMEDYRRSCV